MPRTMGITAILNYAGGFGTFTQVLFALPMTLDLLGMLAFSQSWML